MSTESAVNEMLETLSSYRKKILNLFEPTFIEIVHHIDTTLWTSTKNLVGAMALFILFICDIFTS